MVRDESRNYTIRQRIEQESIVFHMPAYAGRAATGMRQKPWV